MRAAARQRRPLALVLASPSIAQQSPPWVVVDAPKRTQFDTLEGPEIVVRSDGTYVAKYEHEGHYSTALGTYICTSSDRGATWTRIAKLDQSRRASLFAIGERLYLLGVDGSGRTPVGHVLVRRSEDGGRTWTEASDAASGRLHGDAGHECNSSPVAIVGGRVWRIFARSNYGKNRGADVLVASAAVGADLLRADSWRWSNELSLRALSGAAVAGSLLLDDGSDTPRLLIRNGVWTTSRTYGPPRRAGFYSSPRIRFAASCRARLAAGGRLVTRRAVSGSC